MSSYHLELSHHLSLLVVLPLFSFFAKFFVDLYRLIGYRCTSFPIFTLIAASLSLGMVATLMALAGKDLQDRCTFDGGSGIGPWELGPVFFAGCGIFIIGAILLVICQCSAPRQDSRLRARFHQIAPYVTMQVGSFVAVIGFIIFIEQKNIAYAAPYLVGGSENQVGFGQVFAWMALLLPLRDFFRCLWRWPPLRAVFVGRRSGIQAIVGTCSLSQILI